MSEMNVATLNLVKASMIYKMYGALSLLENFVLNFKSMVTSWLKLEALGIAVLGKDFLLASTAQI